MEYTTYWSILDTPAHIIKSNYIGLAIALIGGFCWLLIKKYKKDKGDGDRPLVLFSTGAFTVLGIAMFILLTFIYPNNSDIEVAKMLDSPAVKKVEGKISGFDRSFRNTKYGAETIESFVVDSVHFEYNDALLARFGSFTKTNNSIIYNGQTVRVTYRGAPNYRSKFNSILKIEIGRK